MSMRLFAVLACCAGMFLLTAPRISAAVTFGDSFLYSPVGSDLRYNDGGNGFDAGWDTGLNPTEYKIGSGSLTDPTGTLAVSGNHVTSDSYTANKHIIRYLSSPPTGAGTTAYVSFLMRPEGTVGEGFDNGTMGAIIADNSGATPDLYVGKSGSSGVAPYAIASVGGAGKIETSVTPVSGETVFMVIRVDFSAGSDTIRLYINPDPQAGEPLTAHATKTDLNLTSIDSVTITGPGAFSFDELRIGGSFSEVAPVPEPSGLGLALLGMVGGAVVVVRRRRVR